MRTNVTNLNLSSQILKFFILPKWTGIKTFLDETVTLLNGSLDSHHNPTWSYWQDRRVDSPFAEVAEEDGQF